jgi:hypothetical protein
MPVASAELLHGIQNSSTFISQFTSCDVSPVVESLLVHAAGQVNPQFVAAMGISPEIRFGSTQLKTILDLTGVTVDDLSGANTDLWFKAAADQGNRVASASTAHHRYRAAQALLEVQSISAGHRSLATANCRLILGYDGTNVPLVYAGSTALSGTPTAAENFVLGECHLNGTEIDGCQDISIDFGRQMIQLGSSGELYPTFNAEGTQSPTITIRAYNAGYWGTTGLALAVTSGSFYFRKLATVGRVADGTAEHIKFAVTNGLAHIDTTAGDGQTPSITTIVIKPVAASDTAGAIVLSSTAVAITN